MATTTTMMYTLLPNGGGATYQLSIYVSPRLTGAGPTGKLADYDLGNWPEKLLNLFASDSRLPIELGSAGGPQLTTFVKPSYISELDPKLWEKVFPQDKTKVTSRVFRDYSKRWIRSYPVREVEAYIQQLYNTVADAYPAAFPDLKANTPVTELLEAVGRAKPLFDRVMPPRQRPGAQRKYAPVPGRARATHPEAATEAELTALASTIGTPHIPLVGWMQAIRFYKRGNQTPYRSADEPYDPDLVPDPPEEPLFDFHQALSALGDHPYLLRKLGLIIDVEFRPDPLLQKFNRMQLIAPVLSPIKELTPWTRYQIDAVSGFRPEPRKGGDLLHGLVRLDNGAAFDVIQTDPDGNAIKVYDYAVNMFRYKGTLLKQAIQNPDAKSSKAPEETSLPALRSGGLMVIKSTRDNKLWDTLALQATFESNPEGAELFADDVLRGYRVDVNYRGDWYSLCRRRGSYDIAGETLEQPGPDEGYLKAESASSDPVKVPDGEQQPDLYVHETMLAWRNFSLVAAVPGKAIVPVRQPNKRQKDVPEYNKNKAGAGFDIATNFFAEKKSLPPLRYGETYRFRARAVDLAGNSWAPPPSKMFPDVGPEQAPKTVGWSKDVTFYRFDPVPAPMLIVTKPFVEGESMEHVVIRSRGDAAPEPLPDELDIDESKMFLQANPRWVAAPKAHVGEAEAHGVFDALFTQAPDVSRNLLKKEAGSFDDLLNLETMDPLDPNRATIVDITGAEVAPAALPAGWKKGDPLPDGHYFIHKEDPVKLPYLPDPLAHGVAFMPLDGSGAVLHKPFVSAGWPQAEPFKLLLKPGAAQTIALGGADAEVLVPKGEMLKVRYASAIVPPEGVGGSSPEGELNLMGRWHGMSAAGKDNTKLNGYQHWMITPFRTMTLVHAVEKPISAPKFTQLSVGRSHNETFVRLREGKVDLHSPSTGELEVRARWRDWIDDPASDIDPHALYKDGHVLDQKVDYGAEPVAIPASQRDQIKHEFGDTKHRWVYYRAVGTTRYREYFPHKLTNYEKLEPHPLYPEIIQKKKLISIDGPEYLVLDANGEEQPLNVRSSARPEPPEPLYIVPTFKWEESTNGRKRLGRGLRIYLKRGWFSSGEDEMLGVVLLPAGASESDLDEYREYVTQWGSDPIFDRAGPNTFLTPDNFTSDPAHPETAPQTAASSLFLAETLGKSNLRVRVVPFKPLWDSERKLWYVDLVFGPTSLYYTFVRFALCRYQPHSLPNIELSRVVRTEFAQLIADRTATLTYTAESIAVTVYGPSALSKLGHELVGTTLGRSGAALTQADPPPLAANEPALSDVVLPVTLQPNPAAGRAHRIVAVVESRQLDAIGDLGWQQVDGGAQLISHTPLFSSGVVYWKGNVRWPRPDLPFNRQYRLTVREYEVWETDEDVSEYSTSTSAAGKHVRERLVYVDHFALATGPIISG